MAKINNFKEGIKISNQVINDIMFLYKFRVKETYFTSIGRSKMKNNPWKRSRMLKHIEKEIERNIIPVRPDRKFERKNYKSTQMVNRMNKKIVYKNTIIYFYGKTFI